MNVFTSFTSPSKVPSACLWFCSMSLFTSFTSQSKMSQMARHWFCSMFPGEIWLPYTISKTHICWAIVVSGELSFTESRSSPLTISHHYRIKMWWIQRKTVLWKWYYYRIKNLNSTFDFPIQYQKTIHVGQQGFQGTILFRIKDLRRSPAFFLQNQSHSQSIKSLGPHGLQNQDRTGVQPKMGDFWVFASLWSLIV